MATIQEVLVGRLVENGLWKDQAEAVIEQVKARPGNDPMRDRWNDEATGYPPPLMSVLWLSARQAAVEWIDENKPLHWARPMFNSD